MLKPFSFFNPPPQAKQRTKNQEPRTNDMGKRKPTGQVLFCSLLLCLSPLLFHFSTPLAAYSKVNFRGPEKNMASAAMILVSLLFIACLLKIIWNCPTKKLLRWLQSLTISPWNIRVSINVPSSSSPPTTSTRKKESNDDEKGSVEQRKMLFSTFDGNWDGFITRQELRDSLWGIRIFMTEEEVDEIITRSDRNGDGMIDFAEFCKLLEDSTMGLGSCNLQEGDEVVDGLKEAFNVFDKDGDGLISVEELASVMCSLGLISEGLKKFEDCKEMIKKVDMDGDGMVNFDEFKRMMMPAGSGKSIIAAC